jgi:hypothetical protein
MLDPKCNPDHGWQVDGSNGVGVVWKWRIALGVTKTTNEGSCRLLTAATLAGRGAEPAGGAGGQGRGAAAAVGVEQAGNNLAKRLPRLRALLPPPAGQKERGLTCDDQ